MKKYIVTLGLITLATTQMYSSEHIQPTLDKKAQKKFREDLASYRGMFALQQVLIKTGGEEVKAEKRLREKLEGKIQLYALKNNDPYVEKKIKRLEKFKTQEIPQRLQKISSSESQIIQPYQK